MVKIMENPIKIDDLGYHYYWKHPYSNVDEFLQQTHPTMQQYIVLIKLEFGFGTYLYKAFLLVRGPFEP